MPRLSICIPTYGRAQMLRALLVSISATLPKDVDVVVSDDASPDDTVSIVESSTKELRIPLTLIRQEPNIGFEANFLAVVAAAKGDYVWLMGDDDAVELGAIQVVLDAIEANPGCAGLTLGAGDYDASLTVKRSQGVLPPKGVLHGVDDTMVALADFVGFMSTLVVRRDLWDRAVKDIGKAHMIAAYPQVQVMAHILRYLNPLWVGVHSPIVRYRTDNDHLLSKLGWERRLRIDVDGYRDIRRMAFATAAPGRRFESRIVRSHVRARVLNSRTQGLSTRDGMRVVPYLTRHYFDLPAYWTSIVPLLVMPAGLVRLARRTYQSIPGLSATARARAKGR